MANDRTLTAANAVIMLGVKGLYDTPRRLQGFSADNIANIDSISNGEMVPGVDGRLSAGWVFNPVNQTITLQADSESNDFFDNWRQAEAQRREKYIAFGSILLRAVGRRFTMDRGFLGSVSVMPSINKTLAARAFTLTWETVTSSPV